MAMYAYLNNTAPYLYLKLALYLNNTAPYLDLPGPTTLRPFILVIVEPNRALIEPYRTLRSGILGYVKHHELKRMAYS
jgi:hypothetical protein